MKRSTWIIIIVLIVAVMCGVSIYNKIVTMEQTVEAQWSNVETQYQRRADLIPNLVNTVKGYAAHESETLEGVVKARAEATSITVDASKMTPEAFQEYVDAQSKVTSALGKLIAVAEAYPDLKANENFKELQSQLEGTENRIAVSRKEYNEAVKEFNQYIVKFPKNIVASMFGFQKKSFFEAQKGAEEAPKVEF